MRVRKNTILGRVTGLDVDGRIAGWIVIRRVIQL
jgi:hypothetical protein